VSTITAISDAVAASLNAASGGFSMSFTAKRAYQPSFALKDLLDLRVSVVPRSVTIAASSRDQSQYDFAVDVGVQKKLASGDDEAEIDELLALTEEIGDHLRFRRLEGYADAVWLKAENEPIYAPEHLEQMRQFTSVLTLTYRVLR